MAPILETTRTPSFSDCVANFLHAPTIDLPLRKDADEELSAFHDPLAPTSERRIPLQKNAETAAAKEGSDHDLDQAKAALKEYIEAACVDSSAEKALTSAKGVSYYELGFPNVLRPLAYCNQKIGYASEACLFAYAIHYSVVQEGQDPINTTPPTQFLILNHFPLDEEVATHFQVRLNLPHQECVMAHLSRCGMVRLTSDQVKAAKLFNGLLFNFVCGRSTSDSLTAENKLKGYYVLPLKDEADLGTRANGVTGLIEWAVVSNYIEWKLDMGVWMSYQENSGSNKEVLLCNDSVSYENGWLRLKSGVYEEEDLIDAFVTHGPWNSRCFIIGVAKELCSLSIMQGSKHGLSYRDHWLQRFKVELKYVHQPLLVGYSLSSAGNFLQRPSQEDLWCNAKAKRVILPPEVCILQTGLKGNLWRGAFRLPSVLHGLESALLAAQLRDSIGAQISALKLQEALTSGAYNVYQSYEQLELVGDSYLTVVGATTLYLKDPSMNRDEMACSLHSLVENKLLFRCARASGLAPYVLNESFQIREWVPPGLMFESLNPLENKAESALVRRQRISWRTLADVVEAIVGAYVMYGSTGDALRVMSWLGIPIQYPQKAAHTFLSGNAAGRKSLISWSQIVNFERQLGYNFQRRDLILAALCYSCPDSDVGLQFSRLAFLGDCILSHNVAMHLVTVHSTLDVGTINEMKQSVINKESLASVAVMNKLHGFLTGIDAVHKGSIMAYATALEKENLSRQALPAFGLVGVCAPKVLGDLISSIAAAIFLDCDLDCELVWKVLRPLLEPLPGPGSFAAHPINELTQFCRARVLSLDIRLNEENGVHEANVIVNRESIARFEHKEKRLARKYAAVQALRELELREERSRS